MSKNGGGGGGGDEYELKFRALRGVSWFLFALADVEFCQSFISFLFFVQLSVQQQ